MADVVTIIQFRIFFFNELLIPEECPHHRFSWSIINATIFEKSSPYFSKQSFKALKILLAVPTLTTGMSITEF